jgi:tRNA-specific 2-thiouridylase
VRLTSGRKVVVGRREQENDYLQASGVEGVLLTTVDHPGPTTLVPGRPAREEIEQAAQITAGYSDGRDAPAVRVEVRQDGGRSVPVEVLMVVPMVPGEVQDLMV